MDRRTTGWAKRVGQLASGIVMGTYNTVLRKVFRWEETLVWWTTQKDTVCLVCKNMHGVEFSVRATKGILPYHSDCECIWITVREARKRVD